MLPAHAPLSRHGTPPAAPATGADHAGGWPGEPQAQPGADELERLLRAAAELALDDAEATARLRADARQVTAALAAAGRLPGALVVCPDDPAVVVVRTLAVAWRRVATG